MIIRICAFTPNGKILSNKLTDVFPKDIVEIWDNQRIDDFIKEAFEKKCPIIFIGACGIAVRKIAPYISDKLSDPPVLVMDEKGEYIIPILSGHVGGANELACIVSEKIGAHPVITTATDVEGKFSIDVYAKKNNLKIVNRRGIKEVSAKVLRGESISIWSNEEKPTNNVDVIISDDRSYDNMALLSLCPKKYYLGIGCKKDTSWELIESFVKDVLDSLKIDFDDIALVSSIDLKQKEYGLNEFAQRHNIIFRVFSADELGRLEGNFSTSQFVKEITGVDNVCERAALLAAGEGGKIVSGKTSQNGVTVAVAYNPALILNNI